jgi:hypothetical protein
MYILVICSVFYLINYVNDVRLINYYISQIKLILS